VIKRPSPALVLSAVALFVTLGGTAVAASFRDSAAHVTKKHQSLTARQINKLIAAYVKAHPGPRGPAGSQGASGIQGPTGQPGRTGQPGPGATQINVVQGTNTGAPVGTAGPWTVRMSCDPGGTVSVNITGPGSYYDTTVTGTPGMTATSTTVNNGTLGSGFTRNTMSSGQQISEDVHLFSGATMYELHLQMVGTGSVTPSCALVGSILPIT
jgi:hypothetical protein